MAIEFTTTREHAMNGVKCLIYGESGAGKTTLCRTLPHDETIIISAESGLLSLRKVEIPVIKVTSMDDVREAYAFLISEEGARFKNVCLDSITEIAEKVLAHEKSVAKDPRQAYGALIDHMTDIIKSFRDLPGRNVFMAAKQARVKDDATGFMLFGPTMPGSKLGPAIPYLFDLVGVLLTHRDEDGEVHRVIQTSGDVQYVAKDRSGELDLHEDPDLSAIFAKMQG